MLVNGTLATASAGARFSLFGLAGLALALSVGLSGPVAAGVPGATVPVSAIDNATVQPTGPRSGTAGQRFFNVQGSAKGNFASFGVLDFQFPKPTGEGPRLTPQATLILYQNNAPFTADGTFQVWLTRQPTVSIKAEESPLRFDIGKVPGGLEVGAEGPLGALSKVSAVQNFKEQETGYRSAYTLNFSEEDLQYLRERAAKGERFRLVLTPVDSGVAASWAGFTDRRHGGPSLEFKVAGPR